MKANSKASTVDTGICWSRVCVFCPSLPFPAPTRFFFGETDHGVISSSIFVSDYREAAAKLQKEWRIPQAPHKHFDFAPHVNPYALVNTLNKGLVYEDYQRQFAAQSQHQVGGVPSALV